MNETIKYTSKNGFTGIMYGERSVSIFREDGKEVFHTGSRGFDTYDELVDFVEKYPEFYELFMSIDKDAFKDDDYDI